MSDLVWQLIARDDASRAIERMRRAGESANRATTELADTVRKLTEQQKDG